MPFIPYYYDNYVMAAILVFWIILGAVAVIQGRKKSLPTFRLHLFVAIAVVCALISLFAYGFYILMRQANESAHHVIYGRH